MLETDDAAEPYPLSWDEQSKLEAQLPPHQADMMLYKVNVGGREQEICRLMWEWKKEIPELGISIFLIPKGVTKNKEARLHVMNAVASAVIERRYKARPSSHDKRCASHDGKPCNCLMTYVFGFRGLKVGKMNTKAWRNAWRRAELPPASDSTRAGVHNLKHTFGRRLRAAGVPLETRKVLLGHTVSDITTHYSAPEIKELLDAVNKLNSDESGKSPALTLLK